MAEALGVGSRLFGSFDGKGPDLAHGRRARLPPWWELSHGRGVLLLVLLAGGLLLTDCGGGLEPGIQPGARLWFEGPVRWLMTEAEEKSFRHIAESREALNFIEGFWRRRDPTPGDADNPFRTTFFERASAADQLYAERGTRGSLTDRGRVLVLFGSPSILRYRQTAVPELTLARPGSSSREASTRSRYITQEIWGYLPEHLPARVPELLPEDERGQEITFVFVAERRGTYLTAGESYLEMAVRAAIIAH